MKPLNSLSFQRFWISFIQHFHFCSNLETPMFSVLFSFFSSFPTTPKIFCNFCKPLILLGFQPLLIVLTILPTPCKPLSSLSLWQFLYCKLALIKCSKPLILLYSPLSHLLHTPFRYSQNLKHPGFSMVSRLLRGLFVDCINTYQKPRNP